MSVSILNFLKIFVIWPSFTTVALPSHESRESGEDLFDCKSQNYPTANWFYFIV